MIAKTEIFSPSFWPNPFQKVWLIILFLPFMVKANDCMRFFYNLEYDAVSNTTRLSAPLIGGNVGQIMRENNRKLFAHPPLTVLKSARTGNTQAVKAFLENIYNINKKRDYAREILLIATRYGHKDIAQYLWDKAEINFDLDPMLIKEALMSASRWDQVSILRFYLLETGAELNNRERATLIGELLKTAIQWGSIQSIEFYLSKEGLGWKQKAEDSNQDSIIRQVIREAQLESLLYNSNHLNNGNPAEPIKSYSSHIFSTKDILGNIWTNHIVPFVVPNIFLSPTGKKLLATQRGRSELKEKLKTLIRGGADINGRNKDGDTVLHALLRKSYPSKVRDIFSPESYFFASKLKSSLIFIDTIPPENYPHTPPVVITRSDLPLIIDLFLPYWTKADFNSRGKDGDTLAHAAGGGGNINIINQLYKEGMDLTIKNDKGETVWDKINIKELERYQRAMYKRLLLAEGFFTTKSSNSLSEKMIREILQGKLLKAIEFEELLPSMVKKGFDPNHRNAEGEPALHEVMKLKDVMESSTGVILDNRHFIYARALLENGVDPNAKNKNGDSFLHARLKYAISHRRIYPDSVSLFIRNLNFFVENGFDLNTTDNNGETLLDIAKRNMPDRPIGAPVRKDAFERIISELESLSLVSSRLKF